MPIKKKTTKRKKKIKLPPPAPLSGEVYPEERLFPADCWGSFRGGNVCLKCKSCVETLTDWCWTGGYRSKKYRPKDRVRIFKQNHRPYASLEDQTEDIGVVVAWEVVWKRCGRLDAQGKVPILLEGKKGWKFYNVDRLEIIPPEPEIVPLVALLEAQDQIDGLEEHIKALYNAIDEQAYHVNQAMRADRIRDKRRRAVRYYRGMMKQGMANSGFGKPMIGGIFGDISEEQYVDYLDAKAGTGRWKV